MTSTLVSRVRAVRRRERQRPGLSWRTNAAVGALVGAAVPVAVEIKCRFTEIDSEPPRSNPGLVESVRLVSYCAALGVVSSQAGWSGLLASSVGSSALLAPLGGFDRDPKAAGNWKQAAVAGAVAGPVVIRPFVRLVARAI
jgi:hypothetical protein